MADKELEPQKVRPSSLTSKTGDGPTLDRATDHRHDRMDPYGSVSQKAKLILPTALWVLLVVAGLCFLGLLSSLNKSISTLDTLVEIEQKHHVADHQRSAHAERLEDEHKSSWLSLPSWASLEPAAHHHHHQHHKALNTKTSMVSQESADKGWLDELLKDLPVVGDEDQPKITFSSEVSSTSSLVPFSGDSSPLGIADSILKQLMGGGGGGSDNDKKADSSFLTANIDTINIHLSDREDDTQLGNKRPSGEKKRKQRNRRPLKKVSSLREREEEDALEDGLERMINELNEKLRPQDGPLHLSAEPETILIPLGHPRARPVSHKHHHHQGPFMLPADDGAMSLSKLLMPPPGLMMAPVRSKPMHFNPHEPLGSGATEFVLHLGGPDEKRHKGSPSPYEMMPTIEQLMSSNGPAGFGPNSALDSLLSQTLLPVQESSTTSSNKKESMGPFIISDLNLSPAHPDDSEQQLRKGEEANKIKNQVSDLFSLFFGPPPNSSLVVAPQVVEPKISTLRPASGEGIAPVDQPEANKIKDIISQEFSFPLDDLKLTTTPMPAEIYISSTTAEPSESPAATTDDHPTSGSDPLIGDLLSTMFALPQMSGQSGPVRADSHQSSSSGSAVPVVTTPATETPQTTGTTNTSDTSRAAESSVEKVLEVDVEPPQIQPMPAEDIVRANSLELPILGDLFGPVRPTTEVVVTKQSTSQVPDAPQSVTTSGPALPIEVFEDLGLPVESPFKATESDKVKVNSPTAEIEIFETNKSWPELQTTKFPTTTASQEVGSSEPTTTTVAPERPFKSFLKKADDFIERGLVNFKRLLA